MTERLFVYGTLKRGHRNHYFLEHAEFVGPAITFRRAFVMWDVGFPMVAFVDPFRRSTGDRVTGELYFVDKPTLAECDHLEGHPRFYNREKTAVVYGDKVTLAWIYLRKPEDRGNHPKVIAEDGELTWANPKRLVNVLDRS